MKIKTIVFISVFLALAMGASMLFVKSHAQSKASNPALGQNREHASHDDDHAHEKAGDKHVDHAEGDGRDEHLEDAAKHDDDDHAQERTGDKHADHTEDDGHDEHTGDAAKHDDDHAHEKATDKHADDAGDEDHDEHVGDAAKHDDDDHDAHGHDEDPDIVEMTKAQQQEVGLIVDTARSGDIEHQLSFVGEVRLNEDRLVHLVSRVSGIVRRVRASLGQKVRKGQVLAIIDSPELAELNADYLEKMRHFDLAQRTFERKQYLKQEKIASEADWLEAQSSFKNAETMLLTANRRLAAVGLSTKEIDNLVHLKGDTFGRYALRSPISGTVITKHITRGEKIGEDEVFIVADLSEVWVDLQIPAKDLGRVKEGISIEIQATEAMAANGKLILVGPVVDKESRTALGRVVLPNPDGLWKPGLFVKGEILGKSSSNRVVVPSKAVQNIVGENVVFVPDGDGFRPVEVGLGKRFKDKTQILSGLKVGDRYVTKGAFELKAVIVTSGAGGHAGHGH